MLNINTNTTFILLILILSKSKIINLKPTCNIWIKLNKFFYKRTFTLSLLYFKGKNSIHHMLIPYPAELHWLKLKFQIPIFKKINNRWNQKKNISNAHDINNNYLLKRIHFLEKKIIAGVVFLGNKLFIALQFFITIYVPASYKPLHFWVFNDRVVLG